MFVGVGNGADAIYASLPHGAVDCAKRRDLHSDGGRSGAERSGGAISKTIEGDGNLGSSSLGRFARDMTLQLVVVGSGKSRSQRRLCVVIITRRGNDAGNEMIDSRFQHLPLPANREVGA